VFGLRAEAIREKRIAEPWHCPRCDQIMLGKICVCGFAVGPRRSRPVLTADGELKEMVGDIFRPKPVCKAKDGPKKWEEMYYRSLRGKGVKTFNQAIALFAKENKLAVPGPQLALHADPRGRPVPPRPRCPQGAPPMIEETSDQFVILAKRWR
jgi:hypothetical protein